MNDIDNVRNQIISSGGKILCAVGECFLVYRRMPEHKEYYFSTAVQYPNGRQAVISRIISEKGLENLAETEKQKNEILDDLSRNRLLVYNEHWREKILSRENHRFFSEGTNYIITEKHEPERDSYSIDAPAYGRSGMANQYPWGRDITKELADSFCQNPNLLLEYYNRIRCGNI